MVDDATQNPNLAPESSSRKEGGERKWKVLAGAVLAVAVVAGLYLANRFWVVPAARQVRASNAGERPLAPQFSVVDIHGRRLSLSDYKGKVVMLDFWATWCGPCRIEIPGFVELQSRYRGDGLVIIGISMDDGPEVVREFYQEFRMNYPVVMGDEKIAELYGGIFGMPTTFLIGRDGRIYAKHVGAMDVAVFEYEIKTLLASKEGEEAAKFEPAGRTEDIELGNPALVNSDVPGVDVSGLNATQLAQFKKHLEGQSCTCGCKLDLLRCRRDDRSCRLSRKLAREELAKFTKARV